MRWLLLLFLSVPAFSQTACVGCPGSGAGSATPGGSSGAVQFNDAGVLGGGGSHRFDAVVLTEPSAPTVTTHGTPGSTGYGYQISWANSSGGLSTIGAETDISIGNATLDEANYNIVDPGTCPGSATSFYVYQVFPNYGLVGIGTCGAPFHDTGSYTFHLTDGDGPLQRYFDTSVGLQLPGRIVQPDTGDTYPNVFFGTPLSNFSSAWQNHTYSTFYTSGAKYVFNGSTTSIGNSYGAVMAVNSEWINPSSGNLRAFYVSNANNDTGGSKNIVSIESEPATLGSGNGDTLYGFYTAPIIGGSGNAAEAIGYFMHDSGNVNGSTGTLASQVGFSCSDLTVATTNVCVRSNVSSGASKWAIYAQGTAASFFGGAVQVSAGAFSSLPTCNSGAEGTEKPVTDSSTNTWGATITGGGANHVKAYCDGTNWTVIGK